MLLILLIATKNETEYYMPLPKYQVLGWTATKAEVKEAVEEYMGKEMVAVISCESQFRLNAKNDNKDKKTGKIWSHDIGLGQVNDYYHASTSKNMGMSQDTIKGQFEYTFYLYKKNGLKDWQASKPCWLPKIQKSI